MQKQGILTTTTTTNRKVTGSSPDKTTAFFSIHLILSAAPLPGGLLSL
jgi:hypothetical protein